MDQSYPQPYRPCFQGRYKALLLDAGAYLLELVRYVHLNPESHLDLAGETLTPTL